MEVSNMRGSGLDRKGSRTKLCYSSSSSSSSSFRLCSSSVRCSPSHVDAIHIYFLQFWSMLLILHITRFHLSIFFSVYLFSFSLFLVANPLFLLSTYCHFLWQCFQSHLLVLLSVIMMSLTPVLTCY